MASNPILPPRTGKGNDRNDWSGPNVVYKADAGLIPTGKVVAGASDVEVDLETALGGVCTMLVVRTTALGVGLKFNSASNDSTDPYPQLQMTKNALAISKIYLSNSTGADILIKILASA